MIRIWNPSTEQGSVGDSTGFSRKSILAVFLLSGFLFSVNAQDDEPDPFSNDAPKKEDSEKVAAEKEKAKEAEAKRAKEKGEEPDPFIMNDLKKDPKAKPAQNAAAAGIGAIAEQLIGQIQLMGDGVIMEEFVDVIEIGEKDGDQEPVEKNKDESVQLKISKLLDKMADAEREKRSSFMGMVIEDVSRLSSLNKEQEKELEIAAKGATERSMAGWFNQADRYVQGRMKGATEDTADRLLASIGNVSFSGRDAEQKTEEEELWKESLKEVLSNEQVSNYEKVVNEREAFSRKAFSMVVMSTLDEHLRLTPDQHSKLLPMVEESTVEYLDDIRQYWGDYFEKTMLMSLLGGADDKKVKSILSEKQYERWGTATANFDHFWEQRRAEKKRDEEKKKKAAKKPKK